jgi:hypothetical protein
MTGAKQQILLIGITYFLEGKFLIVILARSIFPGFSPILEYF